MVPLSQRVYEGLTVRLIRLCVMMFMNNPPPPPSRSLLCSFNHSPSVVVATIAMKGKVMPVLDNEALCH
jgi:hypothetical protein